MDVGSAIVTLTGMVFTAGAVYAGIRGDIKHLHEQVRDLKDATKDAHQRIDKLLERDHG